MKSLWLALLLMAVTTISLAQSFETLETPRGLNPFVNYNFELYLRRTQVAGKYTESFGGTTVNMKVRADWFQKGDPRYHFENPTLGDLLFVLTKMLKGDNVDNRKTEQSIGAGFLGWHQVYINAVAADKRLISPGISFGDYIFGTKREAGTTGTDPRTLEPAGYYLHVGPALMYSQIVGTQGWINVYGRYDLTKRVGTPSQDFKKVDGYKTPNFLAIGASYQNGKSRLCGGINYTHMIDRGDSNDAASRIDISIGIMMR